MKKFFLPFIFTLAALPVFGQGIDFRDITVDQAIAEAKSGNKYVFVDVYTDWCGPCKMMDAQIFPLKEIGDYFNPKYVSIKFNAERGEEGPAFANKYGVKAYPTFLIIDGNGELVHMFAGGILDLTFIDKVEQSFDPAKAFGALKKRYDAGERDPRFVASYLEALQNTHTAEIGPMIEEFYNSTSDDDKICSECLFIFDAYARVGSEKDEFLTEHRDRFREAAGRKEVDEVFKRKYVAYFGMILQGYDPGATEESIGKAAERLASLGLQDAGVFPVYEAAAVTKVTGEGADKVAGMIKDIAPSLSDNDKNTLLYYTVIGLKNVFSKEQTDELVALVSNESTKGYIIRSLGR